MGTDTPCQFTIGIHTQASNTHNLRRTVKMLLHKFRKTIVLSLLETLKIIVKKHLVFRHWAMGLAGVLGPETVNISISILEWP